jgi:AcrR family transcriptional regulator
MTIMKSKSADPPRRRYSQVARAASAEETARRIVESFLELLMTEWFDGITLDRVAARAGVAVPTIVRRFGGKDGLLAAVVPVLSAQVGERRAAPPGDVAAAVARLIADYEQVGDSVIRVLALEPRYPAVEPLTSLGRAQHRQWISTTFADSLPGFKGEARERALDALVIATDVYTWKLLRRDMKRSLEDTAKTMKDLILAATAAVRAPKGAHR